MFIIAEIGSNWRRYDDIFKSIKEAKRCGADAIKLQMFTNDELYGPHKSYVKTSSVLSPSRLKEIKDFCDDFEIEFMCTSFSPSMLHIVDKFVDRHKIASAELKYPKLLVEARDTRKPVYISTAGSTELDIERALAVFQDAKDRVTLLYCVGAYPAKDDDYDLKMIGYLASKFRVSVGLSDHTNNVNFSRIVAPYGCSVIEKHFKLDDWDTPDQDHSIRPKEFKAMVEAIRASEVKYKPLPCERDFLEKHNRRLITINKITPGDKFIYSVNYGAFRSEKVSNDYISPFDSLKIEGKLARSFIPAGGVISMKYVTT